MAKVQVNNVVVLDNPSPFYNPFQFEITFECIEDLSEGECGRSPPGFPGRRASPFRAETLQRPAGCRGHGSRPGRLRGSGAGRPGVLAGLSAEPPGS